YGRVTTMEERRALVEMVARRWVELGGPEGAAFLAEVKAACPRPRNYQDLWEDLLAWRDAQNPRSDVTPRAAPASISEATPIRRRIRPATRWCLRCGGPMS